MRAWELIAQPGTWTQDYYAKDANGRRCNRYGPDAVSFCLVGAVDRTYHKTRPDIEAAIYDVLEEHEALSTWNDAPERTQEEVVTLLREVEEEVLSRQPAQEPSQA